MSCFFIIYDVSYKDSGEKEMKEKTKNNNKKGYIVKVNKYYLHLPGLLQLEEL